MMKFKSVEELYNNLGQCIHCLCYVGSKNSGKDCIRSCGHKFFVPYNDLVETLKKLDQSPKEE